MTYPYPYPMVLTKGDNHLEITRDPADSASFVGLHNGRPVVRGSETALVLRSLIGCN